MRAASTGRAGRRILALAALGLAAITLGACASGSVGSLLKGSRSTEQSTPAPIAFAPIIGAPQDVSKMIGTELVTAAQQRRIPVVRPGENSAAFLVKGYLATSPDRKGSKLAYIWDVTDRSNKRVHRITGEEVVAAKPGGDPWAGVDQSAAKRIAAKTAAGLIAWLPKQAATAGVRRTAQPLATAQPAAPARTRTASLDRPGEFLTKVPSVSGAPGDGRKTLTLALKKQLFKKGMKLTSTSGPNVYTVQGTVSMGKPDGGKQSIKIDWQVLDPKGGRLGTVSQQNSVAQGSLDGAWGKTADAAAAAAADGILELLPKPSN